MQNFSVGRDLTPDIGHQSTNIGHRASYTKHQTSGINHQTPVIGIQSQDHSTSDAF
jgi:hypothetical protein